MEAEVEPTPAVKVPSDGWRVSRVLATTLIIAGASGVIGIAADKHSLWMEGVEGYGTYFAAWFAYVWLDARRGLPRITCGRAAFATYFGGNVCTNASLTFMPDDCGVCVLGGLAIGALASIAIWFSYSAYRRRRERMRAKELTATVPSDGWRVARVFLVALIVESAVVAIVENDLGLPSLVLINYGSYFALWFAYVWLDDRRGVPRITCGTVAFWTYFAGCAAASIASRLMPKECDWCQILTWPIGILTWVIVWFAFSAGNGTRPIES